MTLAERLFIRRSVARRYPPLGRMIPAGGGARVHLLAAGPDGVPLVLLHGASGNLRDWTLSLLPRLAERHAVIAVDRPGFGHSDPAPDEPWSLDAQIAVLRGALHEIGLARYMLLGHSYSGALALRWALAHPDEVAGVVDLCGAAMDWGGDLGAHYALGGAPVLGRLMAEAARLVAGRRTVARTLAAIFAPQPVPEGYAERAGIEMALRPGSFRLNAQMMDRLHGQIVEQAPLYPEIRCPVEIVHGTDDRLVPCRVHAVPLARVLPEARLTLIEGAGHMPHHSAPGEVAAAVDRLAADVAGP